MCGEFDNIENRTHSKETCFPSDREINKTNTTIFGKVGGSLSKSVESVDSNNKVIRPV